MTVYVGWAQRVLLRLRSASAESIATPRSSVEADADAEVAGDAEVAPSSERAADEPRTSPARSPVAAPVPGRALLQGMVLKNATSAGRISWRSRWLVLRSGGGPESGPAPTVVYYAHEGDRDPRRPPTALARGDAAARVLTFETPRRSTSSSSTSDDDASRVATSPSDVPPRLLDGAPSPAAGLVVALEGGRYLCFVCDGASASSMRGSDGCRRAAPSAQDARDVWATAFASALGVKPERMDSAGLPSSAAADESPAPSRSTSTSGVGGLSPTEEPTIAITTPASLSVEMPVSPSVDGTLGVLYVTVESVDGSDSKESQVRVTLGGTSASVDEAARHAPLCLKWDGLAPLEVTLDSAPQWSGRVDLDGIPDYAMLCPEDERTAPSQLVTLQLDSAAEAVGDAPRVHLALRWHALGRHW